MKWTKENDNELTYLINKGKQYEEISIIMNRSSRSIQARCYRLKIKLKKISRSEKVICKNCKSEFTAFINENRKFCSMSCSASYTNKGKVKSAETRNKIREFNLKKTKKTKICPVCNTEHFQKKRKTCSIECHKKLQKKPLSNNHKKSISEGRKINFKNSVLNVTGGTTKWFEVETLKGIIKVQGSYEVRTCKILDKWVKEGKIKSWDYTNDRFNYIGVDNEEHTYLIDFKIYKNDGTFYYIETKGYIKENDELKWKSVKNLGHVIEVWFLKDIEEKENMP